MEILEKIKNRSAKVGVIGLGYVGLPLAVLQAKAGYHVFGVDEAAAKVEMVNKGHNYILDVVDSELREVVEQKRLKATTDFSVLRDCDIVLYDENSNVLNSVSLEGDKISLNITSRVFIETAFPESLLGLVLCGFL